MEDTDDIKFTCSRCGGEFDPEPDMVCDAEIIDEPDVADHWKGEHPGKEGAVILCHKCQEELADSDD